MGIVTHTWDVSTQEWLKQPELQSEFDTRLDDIILRLRVWGGKDKGRGRV